MPEFSATPPSPPSCCYMSGGSQEIPCHIFVITHHCNIFRSVSQDSAQYWKMNILPLSRDRSFVDVLIIRQAENATGWPSSCIKGHTGRSVSSCRWSVREYPCVIYNIKSVVLDSTLPINLWAALLSNPYQGAHKKSPNHVLSLPNVAFWRGFGDHHCLLGPHTLCLISLVSRF